MPKYRVSGSPARGAGPGRAGCRGREGGALRSWRPVAVLILFLLLLSQWTGPTPPRPAAAPGVSPGAVALPASACLPCPASTPPAIAALSDAERETVDRLIVAYASAASQP